jgi:hypothetical protein
MNRFPAAWQRQLTHPEPPKCGDAEIYTALREAWLWFNAIQGNVAGLYVDTKATVRNVNQCSIEVNN